MNAPSHLDLLATSRELLVGAVRHDVVAAGSIAAGLRDQLAAHFASEDPDVMTLPRRAEHAVHSGRRRLQHLLDDLVTELDRARSTPDVEAAPSWLARAAEVHVLLRRQAELEALVLRRQRERERSGSRPR